MFKCCLCLRQLSNRKKTYLLSTVLGMIIIITSHLTFTWALLSYIHSCILYEFPYIYIYIFIYLLIIHISFLIGIYILAAFWLEVLSNRRHQHQVTPLARIFLTLSHYLHPYRPSLPASLPNYILCPRK